MVKGWGMRKRRRRSGDGWGVLRGSGEGIRELGVCLGGERRVSRDEGATTTRE
jgi:hypothetical protein